jgi:hypothetical protein
MHHPFKGGNFLNMKTRSMRFILIILAAAAVLGVGCAGTPAANNTAVPNPSTAGKDTASSSAVPPANNQQAPATANRVDVIYFHVTQRCVTCLCFEEHVNAVIAKYYQDAINSGKLSYRVLNSQSPENKQLALKYGAVGSQLFINTIIKGKDSINDVQEVWDWKCRDNPADFEQKVRGVIDQALAKVI